MPPTEVAKIGIKPLFGSGFAGRQRHDNRNNKRDHKENRHERKTAAAVPKMERKKW